MFTEIITVFEHNGLAMGLVFCLWIILFDQRAISRINNNPNIKRCAYCAIIIYYLLIIIEIIQKILLQHKWQLP